MEFVKTIWANPEKFSKEVVDAAQQHGQIIAEYGIPDESRHKARLRSDSPTRRSVAVHPATVLQQVDCDFSGGEVGIRECL